MKTKMLGAPFAFLGNVGTSEILLILVVALIALGPNQLPKVSKKLGRFLGDLRRTANGLQNELRREMDGVSDDVRELREELKHPPDVRPPQVPPTPALPEAAKPEATPADPSQGASPS